MSEDQPRGETVVEVIRPQAAVDVGVSGKPLHVQVAEALGLRWEHSLLGTRWRHIHQYGIGFHPEKEPQRFDEDWSATGPLIERYKFDLQYVEAHGEWWAYDVNVCQSIEDDVPEGRGETPTMAVCELILSLSAAGRLKEK